MMKNITKIKILEERIFYNKKGLLYVLFVVVVALWLAVFIVQLVIIGLQQVQFQKLAGVVKGQELYGVININNISAGWADLYIGYCVFSVSYLSYLKEELDILFDLEERNDESAVNKIILEGENQGDLTLVAYLTYGDLNKFENEYKPENFGYILNIIWQPIYGKDDEHHTIMQFPFDKFKKEYNELMESIKEDYIWHFRCAQNEEEYKEILANY